MAFDFQMHLGDQWTGGVENPQATGGSFVLDGTGYAVRREDQGGIVGHFSQFFDENRTLLLQVFDDIAVVHDFVTHKDRRTKQIKGAIDDLHRPIDPGTETTRVG